MPGDTCARGHLPRRDRAGAPGIGCRGGGGSSQQPLGRGCAAISKPGPGLAPMALVALAQGEGRLPGACAGTWDM